VVKEWAIIVGLSMTPALVAGPPAAAAVGIHYGLNVPALIIVMSVASFVEGLGVIKLALLAERIPRLAKLLERWRKPKVVAFCQKWGPWGGLILGPVAVGIEPILVTLTWMDVAPKRMLVPLAIGCVLCSIAGYYTVELGKQSLNQLDELWQAMKELREL
jgi:hypothetical protein